MILYLQLLEEPEERSKFETIYLEYRDLMFYIANRILHDPQESEDAVHEAFLKIIKILDRIDEPKCPKTKNLTVIIVERVAIDLWRRRKRRPLIPMEEAEIDLLSPKHAASMEGRSALAQAMAALPEKYRSLILLRYDHGFSEAEAAKLLSMTPANVHKTLQRAKKKLEQILEEQEG